MARLLEVSRSGYYRYVKRPMSARSCRDTELFSKIKRIHETSRETYGSPRIHHELKSQGENCSRKRVARIMRENELVGKCAQKKKRITTKSDPNHQPAENLLGQDFSAQSPNEKWVADITEIALNLGKLYIAVIMDLFSRYIIGMSMNHGMTKGLVINALTQALLRREKPQSLIHHSDKGGQYTSHAFQSMLNTYGIRVSHSGTGNCFDNAAMESFFHTLKTEYVYHQHFLNREDAENGIFDYVETFYNTKRRHSYLNYMSPKEFEHRYYQSLIST